MLRLRRGGPYLRVADPDWRDPLNGSFAQKTGGRWNPPGSFPAVYLNRDVRVARANVARKFTGRPYGPELLNAEEAPVLIHTTVPNQEYVDIITDEGCEAVGLPKSYPLDSDGKPVPQERCQPIGVQAWAQGEAGIACRSAAPGAPRDGEELAWFHRSTTAPLRIEQRIPFEKWFWERPDLPRPDESE